MTRVALAVQTIPTNGVALNDIVFTTADHTNKHEFYTSGLELLIMKSTSGTKTATVVSVADPYGRTGDTALSTDASGYTIAGPFTGMLFGQTSNYGKVHVDLTDQTGVSFAVVKFYPI